MKKFLSIISKIWIPAVIVGIAAIQSFGMDIRRAEAMDIQGRFSTSAEATGTPGHTEGTGTRLTEASSGSAASRLPAQAAPSQDTVIYTNNIYTKFRSEYEARALADTAALDSLGEDSTVFISARDTMKVPDSLRYTDPFRYKYYVAIKDSLTHVIVRDSLKQAGDSLDWPKLDSLYRLDSIETAIRKFNEWYASLDKAARKKYDFEQKMKVRQAYMDSVLNAKDSLLAIKDSIRENTPRILETFAVPDSMFYKRILTWNKDKYFNDVRLRDLDTSYNHYFYDYPFMHEDVNVTYLGPIGSAVQPFDFSKRKSKEGVSFYEPYETYSFSPYTLPMYNTKTPYTELAYWGTLFANAERAENNLHIMTTQNIFPSLNFTLEYDRFGSNGMLENEDTDNRTAIIAANYMGKRYMMHAGYIYNKMSRGENGGIIDNFWIRDTTVGSREIDVRLTDASTLIKKNTVFLDQTYRIPFNFIKNIQDNRKYKRIDMAWRDSMMTIAETLAANEIDSLYASHRDSLAQVQDTSMASPIAQGRIRTETLAPNQIDSIIAARRIERKASRNRDTLDTDITTAFIGHSSEYSVYRKIYKDNIGLDDTDGRALYNNNFFLNPTTTSDSLRVMKLENKVFIKLQPWSSDGIVSALNVGIGDRLLNYYMFTPQSYLTTRGSNTVWNSAYIYGGAKGQYKKYFHWDADGYYTFAGKEVNDIGVNANLGFNIYPFRRYRKSPISFNAHFETSLDEPDFYQQNYYSNHYKWSNDFSKISRTEVEGSIDIPHWKLNLTAGYTLMKNHVYYNADAIASQEGSPVSVFKAALTKNFKLWGLHFDNQILFQATSNEEVIPLPMVAINARWYWQFNIVKNVMQMQIGANITYNTEWYAPGYSPALGLFYNQRTEKYGNNPYIDAFVNVQWKRACIFVKLVNAGMGWPMERADYFSAHGYIRPQRAIKFGVFWPFYLQPSRNRSVGSGGSASGSGSGSGSGFGNGSGTGSSSLTGGRQSTMNSGF